MNTPDITVSILMPAYNHGRFIRQAVESVWGQTFRSIELIVVDDHSTDDTFLTAQELSKASPIKMVALRHPTNQGCGAALNSALKFARGEWIATLASDDFYAPEKIERQLELSKQKGDAFGCIHSDAFLVDEQGQVLGRTYERSMHPPMTGSAFIPFAQSRTRIVAISAIARTDLVLKIGGFDASMAAEDFDYHLRLSQHTQYAFVDEPLCYSRHLKTSLGRRPDRFVNSTIQAIVNQRERLGPEFQSALRATYCAAALAYASVPDWTEFARFAALAAQQSSTLRGFLSTSKSLMGSAAVSVGQRHLAQFLPEELRRNLSTFARRLLFF